MASVFLSPSTQEYNIFVTGNSEEYYANLITEPAESASEGTTLMVLFPHPLPCPTQAVMTFIWPSIPTRLPKTFQA